jgi:hypothetical protein
MSYSFDLLGEAAATGVGALELHGDLSRTRVLEG